MAELSDNMENEEESRNLLEMFAELPGGVQRLIIAVLVVLVLIVVVFIQRLIQTEEAVSEGAD